MGMKNRFFVAALFFVLFSSIAFAELCPKLTYNSTFLSSYLKNSYYIQHIGELNVGVKQSYNLVNLNNPFEQHFSTLNDLYTIPFRNGNLSDPNASTSEAPRDCIEFYGQDPSINNNVPFTIAYLYAVAWKEETDELVMLLRVYEPTSGFTKPEFGYVEFALKEPGESGTNINGYPNFTLLSNDPAYHVTVALNFNECNGPCVKNVQSKITLGSEYIALLKTTTGGRKGNGYIDFVDATLKKFSDLGINTSYAYIASKMTAKNKDGAIRVEAAKLAQPDGKPIDALRFVGVTEDVPNEVTIKFDGFQPLTARWTFQSAANNKTAPGKSDVYVE